MVHHALMCKEENWLFLFSEMLNLILGGFPFYFLVLHPSASLSADKPGLTLAATTTDFVNSLRVIVGPQIIFTWNENFKFPVFLCLSFVAFLDVESIEGQHFWHLILMSQEWQVSEQLASIQTIHIYINIYTYKYIYIYIYRQRHTHT